MNSAPLRDASGNINGAVIAFQDISHLKELDRLKDEFLSMVTHDLKNPLTTIKGLASSIMVQGDSLEEATRESFMRSISDEADRLTELVNNLLDMSRLEAGALPLDPEQCYLADIAGDIVRRMATQTDV
jgi:K+-sensing histidine kinase KdpD